MTTAEEKKNPHLEELAEIITFVEASRDDLNSETLTKKLKKVHSEMDNSPLVLKMRARGLRVVNTDSYRNDIKNFLDRRDWYEKNEKEELLKFLLNTVELTHWTLSMAEDTDNQEMTSRALAKVLWMIEEYVDSHLAMRKLEPEEAAAACLIGGGPGGWGVYSFWTFNKRIEEAEEENTGT